MFEEPAPDKKNEPPVVPFSWDVIPEIPQVLKLTNYHKVWDIRVL